MKTKFDDDNLWKKKLTPQQFEITRRGGTERPFTGHYLDNKDDGIYSCICCGAKLFDSNTKYNSHTGWPSFTDPYDNKAIKSLTDNSHFMTRTEVRCSKCDSHLGHVFPDGPSESGLRYCINSISLNFIKEQK